jgi:3-dehydroquinate dehydratase II
MKIAIINGPNLNLLGIRETEIYGHRSFESYLDDLKSKFKHVEIHYYQSNVEGEIVNRLHHWGFDINGIILNAGAYTHTSVAIADAIAAIKTPVVEVHISNIFAREEYRHVSFVGAKCLGSISGFGLRGYEMALNYFTDSKI